MKISHRLTAAVLYEDGATEIRATLKAAVASGADLGAANLSGADLGGADLRGAYLRGADLGGADLRGAYLRGADLRGADLGAANLSAAALGGADLRGAYLRGADLRGADLRAAALGGAYLSWQSHPLLGEILRRAAGTDTADDDVCQRRAFAGLVAMSTDWCWDTWRGLRPRYPDVTTWAIGVLVEYVREGDGAPAELRALAKKAAAK